MNFKRLGAISVFALILLILITWLVTSSDRPAATFQGYTNTDSRGITQPFRLARFTITNRSELYLSCSQGALEIEIDGKRVRNTNRCGLQYDPIIEPRKAIVVTMATPENATRWQSEFLLKEVTFGLPTTKRSKLLLRLRQLGATWQHGYSLRSQFVDNEASMLARTNSLYPPNR